MADDDAIDVEAMRDELARLRAENDEFRSRFRVPEAPPEPGLRRTVRVLLVPDPLEPTEPGRLGPEAVARVAQTLISLLRKRQPDVKWLAEHDLVRVPDGAQCFQIGEVVRRMWGAAGPVPRAFEVHLADDGTRSLRRCLIRGEPESDQFVAGYERLLEVVGDLLGEGAAAHAAGAHHHAGWALKAADVVLAQLALARVAFGAGRSDWREPLHIARPEYEPRYRVAGELPAGL